MKSHPKAIQKCFFKYEIHDCSLGECPKVVRE